MRPAAIFGVGVLWASAAIAQEAPPCAIIEGDPASCAPTYACVSSADGSETDIFVGRTFGWDRGRLEGALTSGSECEGRWWREDDGRGVVEGSCDDGRTFRVDYVYRHAPTGTAIGDGATNEGDRIDAWSGMFVAEFLEGAFGAPSGELVCGEQSVPIS